MGTKPPTLHPVPRSPGAWAPHLALDVGEGWSDGEGGGQACGVTALQRVQTSGRDADTWNI